MGYFTDVHNHRHGKSRSCTRNHNHYLTTTTPPSNRFCLLCKRLTAPYESGVIRQTWQGKKVSVCFNDLRDLSSDKRLYFPKLKNRMPKGFTIEQYIEAVKEHIAQKKMGDRKLQKTLKVIKKLFYNNDQKKFSRFFSAPSSASKQNLKLVTN